MLGLGREIGWSVTNMNRDILRFIKDGRISLTKPGHFIGWNNEGGLGGLSGE